MIPGGLLSAAKVASMIVPLSSPPILEWPESAAVVEDYAGAVRILSFRGALGCRLASDADFGAA